MATSLHRFYVQSRGNDEPRDALTPLLAEVGLRVVGEPDPDLVTRVIRIWRSGEWIVVDDEGGELGEDARESGRWRTCALAIQILHSDVAVIERYDRGGRVGSVSVRSRGGVTSKKIASVFSGLMPTASGADLSAAFAEDASIVETKLERVLQTLGLPSAISVPDSAEVLVVTDGRSRTRPFVQPTNPPALWTLGIADTVALNGVEGQRFNTLPQFLTIDNFGGYASALAVAFSGSALEHDILRIERVLLTPQPGQGWVGAESQPVVVGACDGGQALFAVGAGANDSPPRRLDNSLAQFTVRERWCMAIEGTRGTSGMGELIVTVTADGLSDAIARVEVAVLGKEQVPRRASLDEVTGTGYGNWVGLKALSGDRCLAALIMLSPGVAPGDARSTVLRSWAEAALRTKKIDRLQIVGDIAGVRSLTLADLDRPKRWSKLESQLDGAATCLVGPDLGGRRIRTICKFGRDEPGVIHATLDLDTIDEEDAWNALTSAVDVLASAGVIEQATITPCDHWVGVGSRYELAVGADRSRSAREHLFEPGRMMYLSPSLIGALDHGELSQMFEVSHVGNRVRLIATPSATYDDVERVVTSILGPVLPANEG